jgi:hypothetical protein
MNNLINIQERMDIMQAELNTLQLLVNDFKEEQSKPVGKYELSDLLRETIEQMLDLFIDEEIIGSLDSDYREHLSSGSFNVEVDLDLQDIVQDQLPSSHRLASKFTERLMDKLNDLQNEEDEATESGEQQHQDC